MPFSVTRHLFLTIAALAILPFGLAHADDGPDPVAHWNFGSKNLENLKLKSILGPDATFAKKPSIVKDKFGESMRFGQQGQQLVIAEDLAPFRSELPTRNLTVSAWVAVDRSTRWGGIVGAFQDDGSVEKGWILGYSDDVFSFALSSKGGDDKDGDGRMTYMKGKTKFVPGKLYHVAAVYDGKTMQLFVNGKLDAQSTEQSGDIFYPNNGPIVIGAYRDSDEFYEMEGRIRDVAVYDAAAKPTWVAKHFAKQKFLAALAADLPSVEYKLDVKPFLQYGTQNEMTVVWRTSQPTKGKLFWGTNEKCKTEIPSSKEGYIHTVTITGLDAETQYFYRTESENKEGTKLETPPSTFQTAVKKETPFAFAVIGDTQGNPKVSGALAKLAWGQRPNFLLHAGDLVSTGSNSRHWTDHFFASMDPLISRVPLFPVLGNHEVDARFYYDYMALPHPEYFYKFTYGNTEFFMIDTNRKVGPGSEQYKWLDEQLAKSTSTWKVVCHHHPPYSSDENDYGNLWKQNKSRRGDLKARQLTTLYDKHQVDIVWNGHIHSYERTWPLKGGKAVSKGGTIYMITGGGGGGLETPGPYRPFFQNNVRRGHHYSMVFVNGNNLELKAFSLEDNKLYDYLSIRKDGDKKVVSKESGK